MLNDFENSSLLWRAAHNRRFRNKSSIRYKIFVSKHSVHKFIRLKKILPGKNPHTENSSDWVAKKLGSALN